MRRVIFYSWQSDHPNPTNRGFIQDALENAATAIASDNTVAVEPVVDRDTQGVAGAPDIASTIFAKITAADVFVADISIISHPKGGRPTPNPNVLIELGYALRSLGHERVIIVFNQAFGKIEELPFDLRTRRLMVYNMPVDNKDRATEKKKLEGQLDGAIRAALEHVPAAEEQPAIPALLAIENNQPNKISVLRRNLGEIFKNLKDEEPLKFSSGGTIDDLITAISNTQEPIAEFSKIAEAIAVIKDSECALEVYRWFGQIFEHYDLPKDFVSGPTSDADYDFFRFVGHEIFVTLTAFIIRENRWDILFDLINEPIPISYLRREGGPGNVFWSNALRGTPLLQQRTTETRRVSFRADLLKARHTDGGLSMLLPFDDFMAADLFFFLLGELPPEANGPHFEWYPPSCIYLEGIPMFILKAENRPTASQITKTLGLASPEQFRERLKERIYHLNRKYGGNLNLNFRSEGFDLIGTKGLAKIIS